MDNNKSEHELMLILVKGFVFILSVLVCGEVVISALTGVAISDEILTVIKMSITGLLGIVTGYVCGKK